MVIPTEGVEVQAERDGEDPLVTFRVSAALPHSGMRLWLGRRLQSVVNWLIWRRLT